MRDLLVPWRATRLRGFGLWACWVLASSVGGFATIALMAWLDGSSRSRPLNGLVWLWPSFGALYAIPQWAVLRQVTRGAAGWLPITGVGLVAGMSAAIFIVDSMHGRIDERTLESVIIVGAFGGPALLLGLAQLRVLLPKGRSGPLVAMAWLLASTVGNGLLFFMPLAVGNGIGYNAGLVMPLSIGAAAGAAYGAITGTTLVWLLRDGSRAARPLRAARPT